MPVVVHVSHRDHRYRNDARLGHSVACHNLSLANSKHLGKRCHLVTSRLNLTRVRCMLRLRASKKDGNIPVKMLPKAGDLRYLICISGGLEVFLIQSYFNQFINFILYFISQQSYYYLLKFPGPTSLPFSFGFYNDS